MLSCVWNLRVFPEMHDGDSAPSCCAFTKTEARSAGAISAGQLSEKPARFSRFCRRCLLRCLLCLLTP